MVHLSTPAKDTGVFSTEEVHPPDGTAQVLSRVIAFPRNHYTRAPNVAAGFKQLHLSRAGPLRANLVGSDITKDSFTVTVETWGDGILYSATGTWIEHKAGARDCHFGQFDTAEVHPDATATPQEVEARIQFPADVGRWKSHQRPPHVVCWLNRLDLACEPGRNFRIAAHATRIGEQGFTAHLDTWGNTRMAGAAMCWIAFPRGKKGVATGSFSTSDVRLWSKPWAENSGTIKFADAGQRFGVVPTVLVALNGFDIRGDADLRVKVYVDEVTKEGFRWHLNTWGDTTLYSASASWIALGFE
ncbi:hypothetical protein W97_08581 [Coniosporium apollinis CBS 100218]|uniref:H-type lectin domain-containing protein n=1 Tax=Coniosporium apollinis (strain CBS 100218) TaxID=1168221 RepID=R7Z5W7_CONA1|nr:uncharacterized protein W97_08581 [Coniosporium apollinis CBS 100218]EON69321.1 hypothetical protein W97_08581 [Coniosporium apollinis CBS 100218]